MGEPGQECAEFLEQMTRISQEPIQSVRAAAIMALETMGYWTSPFRKDFGMGFGVPSTKAQAHEPENLTPMPGKVTVPFEGQGSYHGNIIEKKKELQQKGKWLEGVI